MPVVLAESPVYGIYDELALWRPTTGIIAPASEIQGNYFPPFEQLGTPSDVPF
jgi:hypothetical protein